MKQSELTPEEEQYIRNLGNDDGFWRYPTYSTPVSSEELLQKLTDQFEAVPSYVERYRLEREKAQ